jgi:hypothetical protein
MLLAVGGGGIGSNTVQTLLQPAAHTALREGQRRN